MIVKLDVHVEGEDYTAYYDIKTTIAELKAVMALDMKCACRDSEQDSFEYNGKEYESINDWLDQNGKRISHTVGAVITVDYYTGHYNVRKGTKHDD